MLAIWQRLPVVVRAVVLGMLVMLLAIPWSILAAVNFSLYPAIPWSVAVMALYMWLCWRYLGGRGWPSSTVDSRRRNLRARRLSARTWLWCILAFGLGTVGLNAFQFIFNSIFKVPQEPFPNVAALPLVTVLAYILMVAIVAGVYEEAAFRGYMQGPIERRHGPWVAYLVVGIFFWLGHITHFVGHWGFYFAYVWYFLAVSILFGALAYLTDSILPGIVLHALGDAIQGLAQWWQSTHAARAGGQPGWLLPLAVVGVVVCAPAALWAYGRLGVVARREKPQSTSEATA